MANMRGAWLRLAAEVGVVIVPAGLNLETSGTTAWIYSCPAGQVVPYLGGDGVRARSTGVRIPFDPESLRAQLPLLRLTVALWQRGLDRAGLRPPRTGVDFWAGVGWQVRESGLDAGEFPVRFLLGSVALLRVLRLSEPYHAGGRDTAALNYLADMVSNGLTVFLVERV